MFKVKFLLDKYSFSFLVKMNSCWIEISFSHNPQSFQILSVEIVNSSLFKSRDFTK